MFNALGEHNHGKPPDLFTLFFYFSLWFSKHLLLRMSPKRDVSSFMRIFRNFLLGRPHKLGQRFAGQLSSKTQPQPQIPQGKLVISQK